MGTLNTLCDGSPPEYCNCDNAPGKTPKVPYDLDDVFNLIFELFGCGPGDCKCPGKDEMVDARPDQLKTILKTCPKENGVSTIEKGKCAKTGKWSATPRPSRRGWATAASARTEWHPSVLMATISIRSAPTVPRST